MNGADAIAEVLRREGTEFLACFPAQPLIEACAQAGIRPVLCRQERVGMAIADGFSRTSGGKRLGVFAMQQGPGSENAFPGAAPGVRRQRARAAHPRRRAHLTLVHATRLQRHGQLPGRDQVAGGGERRRARARADAPRVPPPAQRKARPVLLEVARDVLGPGAVQRSRLRAGEGEQVGAVPR